MLIFLKSNLVIFWAEAQIRFSKSDTDLHFGLYYPLHVILQGHVTNKNHYISTTRGVYSHQTWQNDNLP